MVEVDSGAIAAQHDKFSELPREDWRELLSKREHYIYYQNTIDCRFLVEFVEDAKLAWKELGFDSLEGLIRDGYGIDPDSVKLAVQWLELNKPEWAVSFESVMTEVEQHEEWKARHESGESYRTIAREVGVPKSTVQRRVSHKPSHDSLNGTPKRRLTCYQISQYTKPATAAKKIREKFGDKFCTELSNALAAQQ